METIDNVLVSLDLIGQEDILLKKASASYMEKPVRNLVEYMLDPNGDSLNPVYNQSEREIADMINELMKQMEANPRFDGVRFVAKPNNGSDPTPLQLENKLSSYGSQILQRRPMPEEDQSALVPYIELYAIRVGCCCRQDRGI